MMLFIDTDRNKATGWEGYDYVVNYTAPLKGNAFLQQNNGNKWTWSNGIPIAYYCKENKLALRIPRKIFGRQGNKLNFEFKWVDNMQDEGNVMDFYISGDTAPGGRFNFVFQEQ